MSCYARCLFGGALFAAGLVAHTDASVTQVFSRGELAANNSIDWAQFGPDFTDVPSGSVGTTTPGNVEFRISQPGDGNFRRQTEGPSWFGTFSYGDAIIWNFHGSDSMRIDFATPTDRVGAQIGAGYFGPFIGYITVFDADHNALGSFSAEGTNNGAEDGSAPFLGVVSTAFDIASVEFRMEDFDGDDDLAINRLDVNFGASCAPDLDGNGVLDLFDFLAFTNLFNAGDPQADFDGDGTLDLFDFLAFTNAFNAGC
jgi:hypothetical protein